MLLARRARLVPVIDLSLVDPAAKRLLPDILPLRDRGQRRRQRRLLRPVLPHQPHTPLLDRRVHLLWLTSHPFSTTSTGYLLDGSPITPFNPQPDANGTLVTGTPQPGRLTRGSSHRAGWYDTDVWASICATPRLTQNCDEYPFKSTIEGGPGASLKLINGWQNQLEGRRLGNMYNACVPDGAHFLVLPMPGEPVLIPQTDAVGDPVVTDEGYPVYVPERLTTVTNAGNTVDAGIKYNGPPTFFICEPGSSSVTSVEPPLAS